MAVTNTPSTLASRLKQRYPNATTQLVPAKCELMKRLEFKADLQPGELTRFDVQLDHEGGFSFGTGSVTLNAAVAQNSAKAEVEGKGIHLRSRVSYDLISRAKDSKSAFARFADKRFIPMVESFKKMEEIVAIDGGQGLGVVQEISGQTIIIDARSWNSYRWLGVKNRTLEAFTAVTGGSQHNGDIVISSVNVSTRTLTVTGTISSVVEGDILFLKGERGNEPKGLMSIAKATSTIYGIDPSTNPLWAANVYDVGASALTAAKIMEAAALSADKGCDEDLVCLVPYKTFQVLSANESTLIRRENGEKDAKTGAKKIFILGPSGDIEVVPYMPMREGEFVLFPEKLTYRIGCQEATEQLAGDDLFFDVADSSDKEMRMFADWTVFCEKPGYITYGYRSDGLALHS
jgi:hypothetical protein